MIPHLLPMFRKQAAQYNVHGPYLGSSESGCHDVFICGGLESK